VKVAHDSGEKFLARVTPFVERDGARNMLDISSQLDIPYQTVRFRLGRLREQGISVSPFVDVEGLGLRRYRVSFDFRSEDEAKEIAPFFGGLHRAAGLHYYARSLVSHEFDTEFMIPTGKQDELYKLLNSLQELSFLDNIVVRQIQWKEILMMKTEYYDYSNREWDVDFSKLKASTSAGHYSVSTGEEGAGERNFDHIDLMIIKSLQLDSTVKSVDLSKKLNVTDSDVSYHMNKHVVARKLIPSFRLKWTGTKDAWLKHTIVMMTYKFTNLHDDLLRHAISIMTSVPFTFNHLRTRDGAYFVELSVPIGYLAETMKYLSDNLRQMKLKPDEIIYPDWSATMNYTIPYHMHEEKSGWHFDAETGLGLILQMVKSQGT